MNYKPPNTEDSKQPVYSNKEIGVYIDYDGTFTLYNSGKQNDDQPIDIQKIEDFASLIYDLDVSLNIITCSFPTPENKQRIKENLAKWFGKHEVQINIIFALEALDTKEDLRASYNQYINLSKKTHQKIKLDEKEAQQLGDFFCLKAKCMQKDIDVKHYKYTVFADDDPDIFNATKIQDQTKILASQSGIHFNYIIAWLWQFKLLLSNSNSREATLQKFFEQMPKLLDELVKGSLLEEEASQAITKILLIINLPHTDKDKLYFKIGSLLTIGDVATKILSDLYKQEIILNHESIPAYLFWVMLSLNCNCSRRMDYDCLDEFLSFLAEHQQALFNLFEQNRVPMPPVIHHSASQFFPIENSSNKKIKHVSSGLSICSTESDSAFMLLSTSLGQVIAKLEQIYKVNSSMVLCDKISDTLATINNLVDDGDYARNFLKFYCLVSINNFICDSKLSSSCELDMRVQRCLQPFVSFKKWTCNNIDMLIDILDTLLRDYSRPKSTL
jgi:hypothetical protein